MNNIKNCTNSTQKLNIYAISRSSSICLPLALSVSAECLHTHTQNEWCAWTYSEAAVCDGPREFQRSKKNTELMCKYRHTPSHMHSLHMQCIVCRQRCVANAERAQRCKNINEILKCEMKAHENTDKDRTCTRSHLTVSCSIV